MAGAFDQYVGELLPDGPSGWLPIDEAGNPTGPATLLPPETAPSLGCAVRVLTDGTLVSATGADLVAPLNSNIDKRTDFTPPSVEPPPPAPETESRRKSEDDSRKAKR